MEKNLLYKTGYATGRERDQCRGCWRHVATGELYLAVMKPSRKEDKREPLHFHIKCFFEKQRLTTVDDLAGFEKLRTKDQTRINGYITRHNVAIVVPKEKSSAATTKKGTKRNAVVKMSAKALRDFGVEYSVSGRAHCCGCRQKIPKGVVRCKKIIYTTEVGMQFGGQPLWHHFDCFVELRSDLGWYGSGDQLPGFKQLTAEDRDMVMKSLSSAATLADVPDAKKAKVDQSKEAKAAKKEEDKLLALMKEQNEEYFKYRDILERKMKKSNWIQILELNSQNIQKQNSEILDAVADIITFGSLLPCPTCKGQLIFDKGGYACTGRISEWAKCDYRVQEPPRIPTKIPSWLASHFPLYHGTVIVRAVKKNVAPTVSVRRAFTEIPEQQNWEPKVKRAKPPLYSMEIGIIGRTKRPREQLKSAIEKMGGKLVTKIHDKLAAIISNEREIERMTARMEDAKNFGIQIVPENFVDDIADGGTIEYIKTASISEWGADPETRINQDEPGVSKFRSIYTLAKQKSVKLKIVDGAAVDPESGLQDTAHVYNDGTTKFFAILSYTDIQDDKNSYFKLQLLESNSKTSYWIFCSWGRIGTTIGDRETISFGVDLGRALSMFHNKYADKTGNRFGKPFTKKPGKFCPVEVDYDEKELKQITDRPDIESQLPLSVQQLMKWIFDINAMRKAMIEFDLDMEKMPLGKLSQRQFTEAMKVLKEITQLIENGKSKVEFTGASNHFYTLIPHDFGVRCPPILSTIDEVKSKIEMIETLMQLEIAYSLLQNDTDNTISPIDCHYNQLKTEIVPLDSSTDEYKLLENYLINSHGPTHHFLLECESIFKVSRYGESSRYEPFKGLHNRKLLWHGSRLTNFVGIFSHGLKIAPPEAPVSGYMFGKGIYFADMATKSANYCWSSTSGILLLCEVALGNMYELQNAKNIVKLPANMHSVKGLGQTYPNPTESQIMPDGNVEIPLGIPVTDLTVGSSLLYNEYIVYDVAQVNVKYALKVNFVPK